MNELICKCGHGIDDHNLVEHPSDGCQGIVDDETELLQCKCPKTPEEIDAQYRLGIAIEALKYYAIPGEDKCLVFSTKTANDALVKILEK